MKPRLSGLIVCVLASCIGHGNSEAQFYTLPAGDGLVNTISDNGIAAGSFLSPQYFIWEVGASGKVNIGGVPAGNGVGGQAKISNDGTKLCGSELNPESGLHEMAFYDIEKGHWTTLGGLGGSSDASISSGWGNFWRRANRGWSRIYQRRHRACDGLEQ